MLVLVGGTAQGRTPSPEATPRPLRLESPPAKPWLAPVEDAAGVPPGMLKRLVVLPLLKLSVKKTVARTGWEAARPSNVHTSREVNIFFMGLECWG